MAPTSRTPVTEAGDVKACKSGGAPYSLPKHSYWFDFWFFVLFDLALFLFIYFVIP